MHWANRLAAIAERSQKIADGAFVQFHAEKPFEFAGKVAAAPAHDLVASGVWPLLDEFDENRFLSGRQFGGPAAGLTIAQTREARRVVTMHPVAQGLAIHAAGLGCARAVSPVENHCKRQHPPRCPSRDRPPREALWPSNRSG